jgi:HlyD family secretion protein
MMTEQHSVATAEAPGSGGNDGAAGKAAKEQPSVATAGAPATGENKSGAGKGAAAPRPAALTGFRAAAMKHKWFLLAAVVLGVGGGAGLAWWFYFRPPQLPPGFASSNGRIEATEIDIATKLPMRIKSELVDEGDFVTAGQIVAYMDTDTLLAQRHENEAKRQEAKDAVEAARSTVKQRESEKAAALAVVTQREAELDLARKNLDRAEQLVQTGGMAKEEVDTRKAALASAEAALSRAKADVSAAEAAILTAKATLVKEESSVVAVQASIDRIQSDIDDSALKTPRSGRIQYRVAQPGEMLPSGGKVLNMVDLSDVYMTFFLPEAQAGRVQEGAEARIVLDAAPQFVIPAKVTYVSAVAQFTPKTVETAVERQKLTFRVKAHIPPELLRKYIREVKTGLPGVAYVQLDPQAPWPANLQVKLPE